MRRSLPFGECSAGAPVGSGAAGCILLAEGTARGVEPRLHEVLSGRSAGHDQVVFTADRVLTLNRMPLMTRGQYA
ncbi:hypothetical protein, partial [Streptomyces sp. NPDC056689]|uniref:hypothetical protein n=1 Tax=Streptomyces sp. NPDC056689 TaxID=3345911 RepID=UPI00369B1196